MATITTEVDVEIDLSEFSTEELQEELLGRNGSFETNDFQQAIYLLNRRDKDCLIYLQRYLNSINRNHDFDGLSELFGVK